MSYYNISASKHVVLVLVSEEVEVVIGKLVVKNGKLYAEINGSLVPIEGPSNLSIRLRLDSNTLERYIEWLRNKPKPVRDQETINKYVTYLRRFSQCSNGEISPETIMKCMDTKHTERALRNYVHMLEYYGEVPKHIARELLDRIKWREERRIAEDEVPLTKVLLSLKYCLEKCPPKYRVVYLALYYSGGCRLEHILAAAKHKMKWVRVSDKPRPYGRIDARYLSTGTKDILYIWLPEDLYRQLVSLDDLPSPQATRQYLRRHGLITPTYIRSFCWQAAKYILGENLARLLQGRIGELKKSTTATSYDTLRYQLDQAYPKWMKLINTLLHTAKKLKDEKHASKQAHKIRDMYNLIVPI